MIVFKHTVSVPKNKKRGVLVLFSGRGSKAKYLLNTYANTGGLQEFLLIGVDPEKEWYPLPNGKDDQLQAIIGLQETIIKLKSFLQNLQTEYDFKPEQTVLAGFSAGAVVALQLALTGIEEYNMVISHNGAIFQPDEIPPASKKTIFVLLHAQDDDCFKWMERYIPTKQGLNNKGHKIVAIERPIGGHKIHENDIVTMGKHLKTRFNYYSNYNQECSF